jgi:alanine racemase
MTTILDPIISEHDIVRPTHVEVNLDQLTRNYHTIQTHVGDRKMMAILKANAYGHGLVRVAQHMETLGADYLGVAFLEEGMLLRSAGISTPILVLGGIIGNQIPLFLENDLTLTASSVEKLGQIEATALQMGIRAKVHLKIDTGMERIGVHYYSAHTLFEAAQKCRHCHIEAIYSHFANSDSVDLTSAQIQLDRFNQALNWFPEHGLPMPQRHMANSGAILQLPASHFEMVRPGILLYGVFPSAEVPHTLPVKPALTWKSHVVYFKVVKPHHPISYGSTWQSDKMIRVVTLPVGYGDGYFRALSNKGQVLIHGKKYPIVGRVCMDQTMVNIGWDSAYNGDEVILMGEGVSVEEVAENAGTIPYEVLTNINTRVPRIYINNDNFNL